MIAAFMAVNTYLIDAFTLYAASAMAANTILRSVRTIFVVFGAASLKCAFADGLVPRFWAVCSLYSVCRCITLLVW